MDIFVFKTNVTDEGKIPEITPHLETLNGIVKWNFDLEDTDKILRIEAVNLPAQKIESVMAYAGYSCEELPD